MIRPRAFATTRHGRPGSSLQSRRKASTSPTVGAADRSCQDRNVAASSPLPATLEPRGRCPSAARSVAEREELTVAAFDAVASRNHRPSRCLNRMLNAPTALQVGRPAQPPHATIGTRVEAAAAATLVEQSRRSRRHRNRPRRATPRPGPHAVGHRRRRQGREITARTPGYLEQRPDRRADDAS